MTFTTQIKFGLNRYAKTLLCVIPSILLSCSVNDQEDLLFSDNTSQLSSSSVKIDIQSVTADKTYDSYVAANTIDDSFSTRWRADGTSINLVADLGATKSVDYIRLSHSSGSSRKYYFEVWVRETSSSSWVKLEKFTTEGNSTSLVSYDITDSNARFVRVKCNGNDVNDRNEIKKFEVWGTSSDVDASNQAGVGTNDNSVTEKPVSTNDFQINDFYIESSWNTIGSLTISEDAAGLSDDEYKDEWEEFYYMSNNEITLISPITDGERTEFKEKKGFEASLETYKKMDYTAKIMDIPNNGVTIAQIHNRGGVNRPYVRVYVEHGEVIIKETITDPDESSSSYVTYDDNGLEYTENTSINVIIETKDGKAKITIKTTHGSYSETFVPGDDWDEFANDFYLKAGVYTEGDDSNPMIAFSSFKMDK